MRVKATRQTAYRGKFAVMDVDSERLIHGGGVTVQRPRLYETAEAAEEAAAAMHAPDYDAREIVAVELI